MMDKKYPRRNLLSKTDPQNTVNVEISKSMFFSLTKNHTLSLNTKWQLNLLLLFEFEKAVLLTFLIEITTKNFGWHLVFSHRWIQWKENLINIYTKPLIPQFYSWISITIGSCFSRKEAFYATAQAAEPVRNYTKHFAKCTFVIQISYKDRVKGLAR